MDLQYHEYGMQAAESHSHPKIDQKELDQNKDPLSLDQKENLEWQPFPDGVFPAGFFWWF